MYIQVTKLEVPSDTRLQKKKNSRTKRGGGSAPWAQPLIPPF